MEIPKNVVPGYESWRPEAFEKKDGIWIGPRAAVSYPEAGHEIWPESLDNWWYAHRAQIVLESAERYRRGPRAIWDIGGGTGLMSAAFREQGWATVVVEPIEAAARLAVSKADIVFAGVLEDLEVPPGSVPALGLFDVIEHLDDPTVVLRHCQRILAPGGIVLVTVPAIPFLWSATDRAAGHKRRYTKAQMRTEAAAVGLRAAELRYFFVLPALAALPLRLAGDSRRQQDADEAILRREARLLTPPPRVDGLLHAVLRIERSIGRHIAFPIGLSLMAVLVHE